MTRPGHTTEIHKLGQAPGGVTPDMLRARLSALGEQARARIGQWTGAARDYAGQAGAAASSFLSANGVGQMGQDALRNGLISALVAGGGSALLNRLGPRDEQGNVRPMLSPSTMALLAGLGVGGMDYARAKFNTPGAAEAVQPSWLERRLRPRPPAPPVPEVPAAAAAAAAPPAPPAPPGPPPVAPPGGYGWPGMTPPLPTGDGASAHLLPEWVRARAGDAGLAAAAGAGSAAVSTARNLPGHAGLGQLIKDLDARNPRLSSVAKPDVNSVRQGLVDAQGALRAQAAQGVRALGSRAGWSRTNFRNITGLLTGSNGAAGPAIARLGTQNPVIQRMASSGPAQLGRGFLSKALTRGGGWGTAAALLPDVADYLMSKVRQ